MRRLLSILLVPALFGTLLFARSGQVAAPEEERGETKIVHLKSDLSGPVRKGDSVIFMVGNFAAQHNGAVITADSAVRYSDAHIECFGNVLINKNTTYIYGDRADYNRELNQVFIYSPIVKVVDGEATLYTRHFEFNTKENIGRFKNGGVLTNRDNLIEADRGYYYADTKNLIGVERVEMRNEEYELRGDSVVYNMQSDSAYFFERTNIWNVDGDYLYGDRGQYSKADARYMVTRNGYLLTKQQELWSDTLDYYRTEEHVILRHNLQIDDTEHKNLCFGDYGEYWKAPGNAFLTNRPSVINYDLEQGPDSLFMRSDSIYLYTLRLGEPIPNEYALRDSLARVARAAQVADSLAAAVAAAEMAGEMSVMATEGAALRVADGSAMGEKAPMEGAMNRPMRRDSEGRMPHAPMDGPAVEGADSVGATPAVADSMATDAPAVADSLAVDSLAADSLQLSPKELRAKEKQRLKEEARKAAEARRAEKAAAKKALLDSIGLERQMRNTAKLKEMERRDSIADAKRKAKARAKMKARYDRLRSKGKLFLVDTAVMQRLDSMVRSDEQVMDSMLTRWTDSLDSVLWSRPAADSTATPVDSIYRLMKGFRNVRIYRSDFQAVCDSLTGLSSDSTLHMYIEPVLWNGANQITSEVMDIYTANQKLHHADFVGEPLMASQFDTVYYDQIAGKEMQAFFIENEIRRVNVNGNVQTIFFQKDGEPQEVVFMAVIESGDASFFIEQRQLVQIVYRVNPVWPIYPIDKIPEDQSLYLQNFKWEGDRRPTRDDVFDRVVRPSERRAREQLRRPSFPIQHGIDEQRKRLMDLGTWADRNEEVDAATVEWMRSLGYEVGQPRE